jgi:hypothetical protein
MSSDLYDDIESTRMGEEERRIRRQVRQQAEFYKHLTTYVVVIAGLWILNFFTIPASKSDRLWAYWAIWPTLGWGIGLFFHGLSAMSIWQRFGHDWEERKVRELMAKNGRN